MIYEIRGGKELGEVYAREVFWAETREAAEACATWMEENAEGATWRMGCAGMRKFPRQSGKENKMFEEKICKMAAFAAEKLDCHSSSLKHEEWQEGIRYEDGSFSFSILFSSPAGDEVQVYFDPVGDGTIYS